MIDHFQQMVSERFLQNLMERYGLGMEPEPASRLGLDMEPATGATSTVNVSARNSELRLAGSRGREMNTQSRSFPGPSEQLGLAMAGVHQTKQHLRGSYLRDMGVQGAVRQAPRGGVGGGFQVPTYIWLLIM